MHKVGLVKQFKIKQTIIAFLFDLTWQFWQHQYIPNWKTQAIIFRE